jgi:16S rRNA G527 N7-methylase RsmG
VHAGRAETLAALFDAIALRAVDSMESAVSTAVGLAKVGGILLILTTEGSADTLKTAAGEAMEWPQVLAIPGSESRILLIGRRKA